MTCKRLTAIVFAAAVSTSGASPLAQLIRPKEDDVRVEYDRGRDFSRFKTFAWQKEQKPAPNLANHIRLTVAVQKQLQSLGLSPDTRTPDVQVLYSLDEHSTVEFDAVYRRSPGTRTPIFGSQPRRVQERTLSVLLVDAETNAVVWAASGSREVLSPDKEEKELNELVRDLFAKYPKDKPKTK